MRGSLKVHLSKVVREFAAIVLVCVVVVFVDRILDVMKNVASTRTTAARVRLRGNELQAPFALRARVHRGVCFTLTLTTCAAAGDPHISGKFFDRGGKGELHSFANIAAELFQPLHVGL